MLYREEKPFFCYFEFLLTIYLFFSASLKRVSGHDMKERIADGSIWRGGWGWERADRSVGMGAWRWEHGDGSVGMGAWGWEHGDGSVEFLAS